MSAAATDADTATRRSAPLGASVVAGGVNFSIYSRNASAVDLLLFDRDDDSGPSRVILIDPVENRTYHYWHAFNGEGNRDGADDNRSWNCGAEGPSTDPGNNAYCQDNEIGWFDWSLLEKHSDAHRFVRLLIEKRVLPGSSGTWRRWIDTALDTPQDIVPWQTTTPLSGSRYLAGPRSVVALYTEVIE